MLRSWAEVIECAAELWHALPGTPGPVEPKSVGLGDHGDAAMSRLGGMAAAWHRGLIRGNWPGAAGPGDGRLLGIAENLSLAEARLCGREPPRPQPTEVLVNSGIAKARLVHTLYVGAHGLAVALRLHERDLLAAVCGKHRLPFGESFEQPRQAQHRIAAFEQLAGSCVARTYPDGSRALFREPIGDGRLAQALARWDVQAHRTLATSTSAADLMVISQTERAIGAWSHPILRAAATTGAVDGDQQREHPSPAMARVKAAWPGMADLWRDLTHRTQRCVAGELHYSASEVRDALQEIVHNNMTVAAPEVMATRTDLRAAAQTTPQSLSTSVNLACLIRDTVASAAVVGDGRGISAIVARSPEAQEVFVEEDMAAAWGVSPWATATNALIPVPPPVQEALVVVADRVLDATSAAMNAGAFLDRTPPARIVDHSPAMGWERGSPMPHLDFGLSGPGSDR